MKHWYETLFTNYADQYEKETFTQGTMGEVDFIEKEIQSNKAIRILDLGCGTGRHAVELAARGYTVTGVDLSENMLGKARRKAEERGVHVRFLQGDARDLSFAEEFDLVIMICEGAFPLMETDEMNFQILKGACRALAHKGLLIMTTLNGLYALFQSVPDEHDSMARIMPEGGRFDLMTFREQAQLEMKDDDGQVMEFTTSERFYTPAEMKWLLNTAGFAKVDVCGCTLGAFSRTEKLTPDHFEMLIVASVI